MYNTNIGQTKMGEDLEYKSSLEIYSKINCHMIEGIMFHDQMADMYDFLGYPGFKRMHEYQHLSESVKRRCLKRYVLNHHNKLIMDKDVKNPKVISEDWYGYTRYDVTSQSRKQYVQKSFKLYKDWEMATKDMYEHCAKALLDMGQMADFKRVMKDVEEVDFELKRLERLCIELAATDYNDVYISSIQHDIHEKFKTKTDDIKICEC